MKMKPLLQIAIPLVVALSCTAISPFGLASPPPQSPASGPHEKHGRALAEAESIADSVRRWVFQQVSDAAAAVEVLTADAEAKFAEALRELRAQGAKAVEVRTGLRVYGPSMPGAEAVPAEAAGETVGYSDDASAWEVVTDETDLPARIVLLIHGLDEPGDIWDDMAPALTAAGHAVIRFDYPNDQRIATSADALAIALTTLKSRGVTNIDIVGHSMGGLVARDVLTRPQHYNGDADQSDAAPLPDIDRLFLVGTPNYGSPLAKLRIVAEIREQILRVMASGNRDWRVLLGYAADGAGEAGQDLSIGSDFLNELNQRPHPRHVRITCIVGEMAPPDANRLDDLLNSDFARRVLGDNAAAYAEDVRALSRELGDGVVPISSARLEGVEDVVAVHANHRTMLVTLEAEKLLTPISGEPAPPPAIAPILERLKK